jgi:predicted RNA polymerase sigma factor
VALTLRLLGGLSTDEIARAFLVPESTVAQRIVRAKRTLASATFELPPSAELQARLASVLEVVYLIFNEGYAATAGADWTRPALCQDALRLGRILAGLMPDQPEVYGLVALMELQASRLAARLGPDGEPVLLADQDRRRWDRLLIRRGLAALHNAERLGALGPYCLQASIAAVHAQAPSIADTDWVRIADLYTVLVHVWPSPVAELNRAVAVGRAHGPAAGLAIVDSLASEAALKDYALLPAVRADLLAQRPGARPVPGPRRATLRRSAGLEAAEQAVLGRVQGGGGPAGHRDLRVDVLDVVGHRLGRHAETGRDLLVGPASGQQPKHLDLAGGQAGRPVAPGRRPLTGRTQH